MTTKQKNLYEDLIQGMIVEGIKGMTPELKKIIENAPIEEKRPMILDILEENSFDHRFLCNKIQKIIQDSAGEISHIKEIVKMLRQYVKVSDVEVKKYGEIMTPIELVEEMLDTLPSEVWMNPNLKWLDPCNGVGTFISVVVERLMKGLEVSIPDDKERYKHIMENMIYACELQAKNMFLYMYAFDPKDEYALNIYNGSFLSDGFNKHMCDLGVDKFDIIVMNPPYQELKEGNTKSQALWDKFVLKVLEISLVINGYLVAIHPDSWRGAGEGAFKKVKNILKSKQMLYLEVHDKNQGFKTFGATTTYDFYCVRNTENLGNFNTKIKCIDGKIERADLSKMEFIPNGMYDDFQKLMPKKGEETVNLLYSRSAYGRDKQNMSKIQTEEFKYPCVYYTYKDGSKQLWYSTTNKNGHFEIPKVIWSNGGASTPYVDVNGEYGVMNFAYAIVDDIKNLERIKQAMMNPEFWKLMSFSDGNSGIGGQRYNRKVISLFRKDFWMDFI